jgi:hypothetical protein
VEKKILSLCKENRFPVPTKRQVRKQRKVKSLEEVYEDFPVRRREDS